MDPATVAALCLLFALGAALYSSVGHGGASAYIAAMALFSLAPEVMKPTALALNLLVAGFGTWRYARRGLTTWKLVLAFALTATPAAFIGGGIHLPALYYKPLVGLLLWAAAIRLLWQPKPLAERATEAPPPWVSLPAGAVLGLLAGLTGTGGGIFLSPLIILNAWEEPRHTSGVVAAFILLNSIAGVATFRRGARGRGAASIVLSAVPALLLIYGASRGFGKPAINDITTDLTEPPNLVYAQSQAANAGRDMVYPESFKEIVRAGYPDLKPLHLAEPPDAAFARAVRLAEQQPTWQVLFVNGTSRIFEGVATSDLFRFQDDFVLRVRPDGTGSVVDMRSKSRDGKGDLGTNEQRIRGFLSELSAGK